MIQFHGGTSVMVPYYHLLLLSMSMLSFPCCANGVLVRVAE